MILFFSIVLVFLGIQLHALSGQRQGFAEKTEELSLKAMMLEAENTGLVNDLEYYSDDANLVKQLREKFNYKFPDEKMLIIVEPQESIEE